MTLTLASCIALSLIFFILSFRKGWGLLAVPAMLFCLPIFLDDTMNLYVRVGIIVYWIILFFDMATDLLDI